MVTEGSGVTPQADLGLLLLSSGCQMQLLEVLLRCAGWGMGNSLVTGELSFDQNKYGKY